MEFEHFALNVPDAEAMANWYVNNCHMSVALFIKGEPDVYFLADKEGRVMMELYSNPIDRIPDYSAQHPLRFHFAFDTPDALGMKDKLLKAGATFVKEDTSDDGSYVVMLRDPWGLPLQLCKRAVRLL